MKHVADVENATTISRAYCGTAQQASALERASRVQVCALLAVDANTDPRSTYNLWGVYKGESRPVRAREASAIESRQR